MSQKSKQMQQKEIDKANYGARAERTEAAEKVNKSQSSMNSECRYLVKTESATYNISHKLLRPSQFLEKFMKILEWSTLQK